MYCNKVTVSIEEAHQSLLADGYEPDTAAYFAERSRRYEPDTDAPAGQPARLVEREDWDPNEPAPVAVYSVEEMERLILRDEGHEPGTIESWNARLRLFEPNGAGPKDGWIKRGTRRAIGQDPQTFLSRHDPIKVGAGYAFVARS